MGRWSPYAVPHATAPRTKYHIIGGTPMEFWREVRVWTGTCWWVTDNALSEHLLHPSQLNRLERFKNEKKLSLLTNYVISL